METSRLLDCLADDYARLREVAALDLAAPVPSCPGWAVRDLVHHVAEVYLHKTEAMRQQKAPSPWPPDLSGEEPIALLDRAYAELVAEFAGRAPEDPAFTWHEPDQTVRFWIRRMAQETVIHRVDGELALGEKPAPIPADLAVDGIDEVLKIFLDYGSHAWHAEFEDDLDDWAGRRLIVGTEGGGWTVTVGPAGVAVADASGTADGSASVQGAPAPLLLSLWNRGGDDDVVIGGDRALVDHLRRLLVIATQ